MNFERYAGVYTACDGDKHEGAICLYCGLKIKAGDSCALVLGPIVSGHESCVKNAFDTNTLILLVEHLSTSDIDSILLTYDIIVNWIKKVNRIAPYKDLNVLYSIKDIGAFLKTIIEKGEVETNGNNIETNE